LLQGEFASETDYGARWRQWRGAAMLAAALLCVHVGAQALQIRQANKQTAALDSEIAQVFASAMPTEGLQDPRRQMQSRLDLIHKSAVGPQVFLRAMQVLSTAIATQPNAHIEALSFHEQTLDLKLSAPSVDALSQLVQSVGKQGITADIKSSAPVAGGVEAQMQLRIQKPAQAHR
jgi:general secretion pathway protein L